jgi:subtilisin family serine protease
MKQIFFLFTLAFSLSALSYNEVTNGQELRQRLNLTATTDLSGIKIAIIDNGFDGFRPSVGMLPDSTELITPARKSPVDNHGLGMAQIVWEATGKLPQGPKFFLLNGNGFTNFKHAVSVAIEKQVDIVLYAQVWSFGSNFDGKGFINAEVNKAIDKGIIWINSAGNTGGQIFNGNMATVGSAIEISNKYDDLDVTFTLSWNDFAEREDICSNKDLDFELVDRVGKVIASSALTQGASPDPKDPKDQRTCYPREEIKFNALERGDYSFRVKKKSSNFGAGDVFRLMVSDARPDAVAFKAPTIAYEIMAPADNPRVFTIGEKSGFGAQGPTIDNRVKPDVIVENTVVNFSNGAQLGGTSNAAAMVVGAVAVMKALNPDWTQGKLLKYSESLRSRPAKIPAGLVQIPQIPAWIYPLIPANGHVRQDPGTGRVVILSHERPVDLPLLGPYQLRLSRANDIVVCLQNMSSCGVYPISQDYNLRLPLVEFRQLIPGADSARPGTWSTPVSFH